MSVQDSPPNLGTEIEPDDVVIRRLVRAIDYAEGFWLGFAKSNTPAQRRRLAALCKDLLEPLKIRVLEIELDEPITDLLPILRERIAQEKDAHDEAREQSTQPKLAIFVHGLEHSIPSREAYPPLLSSLNLNRELFRQQFPHPLLLWLPDYALTALARKAPDFWAWRSGLYEFAPEREAAEQLLKAVSDEAIHVTASLSEQAKRERLVMLKGLLEDYHELGDGLREQESRASILSEMGLTSLALCELTEARQAYKELLTISRRLKNVSAEALALFSLGRVAHDRGESVEARRFYDESLEITKTLGDESGVALILHELGRLAQDQGGFVEARRLYDESLEIAREAGNQIGVASTLNQLGTLAQIQYKLEEARRFYDESLEIKKGLGDQSLVPVILHNLASLAQARGERGEAHRLYEESLEIAKTLGYHSVVASTLNQLGLLAKEEGDTVKAARLFSKAMSIFERLGLPNAEIARRNLLQVEGNESIS